MQLVSTITRRKRLVIAGLIVAAVAGVVWWLSIVGEPHFDPRFFGAWSYAYYATTSDPEPSMLGYCEFHEDGSGLDMTGNGIPLRNNMNWELRHNGRLLRDYRGKGVRTWWVRLDHALIRLFGGNYPLRERNEAVRWLTPTSFELTDEIGSIGRFTRYDSKREP